MATNPNEWNPMEPQARNLPAPEDEILRSLESGMSEGDALRSLKAQRPDLNVSVGGQVLPTPTPSARAPIEFNPADWVVEGGEGFTPEEGGSGVSGFNPDDWVVEGTSVPGEEKEHGLLTSLERGVKLQALTAAAALGRPTEGESVTAEDLAALSPAERALFERLPKPVSQEESIQRLQGEIEQLPVHPGFSQAVQDASKEKSILGAGQAFVKSVWENDDTLGILGEQAAQLLPQIVTMVGGVGASQKALGFMAEGLKKHVASMGSGGFISSVANTYGANVSEALEKGLTLDQSKARAALQSYVQGGVDAATSAVIPWNIGSNQFINIPSQTMIQILGGGGGEILRSKVVGEEAAPVDVAVEGLLEALGMPGDFAAYILSKGKETAPPETGGGDVLPDIEEFIPEPDKNGQFPLFDEEPTQPPPGGYHGVKAEDIAPPNAEGVATLEGQLPLFTPEEIPIPPPPPTEGVETALPETPSPEIPSPEIEVEEVSTDEFVQEQIQILEDHIAQIEARMLKRSDGPTPPAVPGVKAAAQEPRGVPEDSTMELGFTRADNIDLMQANPGLTVDDLADKLDNNLAQILDKVKAPTIPHNIKRLAAKVTNFADRLRNGEDVGRIQEDINKEIAFADNAGIRRFYTATLNLSVNARLNQTKPGKVLTVGFDTGEFADGFIEKLQRTAESWLSLFAPDEKVVLVESNAWNKIYSGSKSNTLGSYLGSPFTKTDGNGINYIRLAPKTIGKVYTSQGMLEGMLDTMAHEFGHMLELKYFKDASINTQIALLKAYRRWARRIIKKNKAKLLTKRQFIEARDVPLDITRSLPFELNDTDYTIFDIDYTLNFSEFLAQQTARYAKQNSEMLGPVREFFRDLYNKMKAFFKANKQWIPEKTVKDWLDSLQYNVMLKELRAQEIKKTDTSKLIASTDAEFVQAGLQRLDKAVGGNTGIADSRPIRLDGNNDPSLSAKGGVSLNRALVRFNKFMDATLTLTQIEDQNRNVPGVQRYVNAVRQWWTDKSRFTRIADIRARELVKLSEVDREALAKFVHAQTIKSDDLKRGLTVAENAALAQQLGITLSDAAQDVLKGAKADFRLMLRTVYEVMENDLERRFAHLEPIERDAVIKQKRAELRAEHQKMASLDYWPLSRFGKFWVQAKTRQKMNFQGRNFRTGDVFIFEVYETEKDAKARVDELQRHYGSQAFVGGSEFSDTVMSFQGMPPQLVRKLQMMIREKVMEGAGTLTADELSQREEILSRELTGLDEVLHHMSPGNSFKNRLQRRKKTPGYSLDVIRGYAAYMQGAANHVSRVLNYREMMDAIGDLKTERMKVTTHGFNRKIVMLENHLRKHYEYAMNPGEEWAQLRAVGFLWYLGFSLKSATVNLSQVPMFTFPYLGKRFGSAKTVKELSKAMLDMRKLISRGVGLEVDLQEAIAKGQESGILEESLATELSALAEGSNLQRLLPGSFLKSEAAARAIRTASQWGAWMFQKVEMMNRYQTFIAAYRMSREKLLNNRDMNALSVSERKALENEVFIQARTAVEKTQFEYARWNRPRMMRGRPSSIFLFKMYTQNALYFVATDPAKLRYLAMLGVLAGAMGLPGAEDILDLTKLLAMGARRVTGREDLVLPNMAEARKFLQDLNLNPDLFMHGTSHELFYLWDLSGSIGQGNVLPGVAPLVDTIGGKADSNEGMGKMAQEILGPAWGIPIQISKALTSSSPNTWREAEKAMPRAIANAMKAYRLLQDQHDTNYAGHPTPIEFDPSEELHMLELLGQGFGFTPERLSEQTEKSWARKEAGAYWMGRKKALLTQYSYDSTRLNREGRADLEKAIRQYNAAVPDRTLRITPKMRLDSVRNRRKSERATMYDRPKGRQGRGIYKEFEEAWEESSP